MSFIAKNNTVLFKAFGDNLTMICERKKRQTVLLYIDTISKVPSENMRKYLHILIRNICIDERRKSNHSEEMYEKFSDVAGTHSTENMAIGTVAIREIADIILGMPEKYKDILLLVYYYEHTVEEASIAMGISANAAYQRLSRAKKLLKDVLTKEGQL